MAKERHNVQVAAPVTITIDVDELLKQRGFGEIRYDEGGLS